MERLMRVNGWVCLRRKKVRTTERDPAAERASDLANRQFTVAVPNPLVGRGLRGRIAADAIITHPPRLDHPPLRKPATTPPVKQPIRAFPLSAG
ncbi:hypothetical protein [Nocardia sp. JCM 34519]|uniref:hypothetical protein n=2 Tax=unclassified Nocardia TaxID=2637762 RepID=UPI0035AB9E94